MKIRRVLTELLQRNIIKKASRSSCKLLVILARFSLKIEFFKTVFLKNTTISNFHENPSSVNRATSCEHADGRTDATNLTDALRNFSNAPNYKLIPATIFL
jgi:hypothetical protein